MARPRKTPVLDNSVWAAALEGLEMQKHRLEEQIRQVRAMMGAPRRGRPPASPAVVGSSVGEAVVPAAKPSSKRTLSPAARKRIAAAQKKRWEAFRKKKEASAEEA